MTEHHRMETKMKWSEMKIYIIQKQKDLFVIKVYLIAFLIKLKHSIYWVENVIKKEKVTIKV